MWALIPTPWRILAAVLLAGGLFGAGVWTGDAWRQGRVAVAQVSAHEHANEQQRLQARYAASVATKHAVRVRTLNRQLETAHARIAQLYGRDCLDPGTVGVLNDIGGADVRTAAGEPDGAAGAAAGDRGNGVAGAGLRFSTNRDVAGALALCRARYAEVAGQVNAILDIEEARHAQKP